MTTNAKNYTITRTSAPSTRGHGYHDLREYAGAVPHREPPPPPTPTGQVANFHQAIAASMPQSRHSLRSTVAAFAVGVVVGDRIARMRRR
jgi:hypothetical protein